MFRSNFLSKAGLTPNKTTAIINGESSSSSSLPPPAKYLLFTFQNQNIVMSNSRVSSTFYSFFTTTSNNASSKSFVVSYLMNSCGLTQHQAAAASKNLNFKTTCNPDSVLTLLKNYGFTQPHISKLINKRPHILLSKPDKTLKPKFDFFNSKGLYEIELADFISNYPTILWYSFDNGIIPSFDILKGIVHTDRNVVKTIKHSSWILTTNRSKLMMVNVEHLKNEGVPETNISKYVIKQPRAFALDVDSFREIVEKVKGMGFNHLEIRFIKAVHGLASMTEANWRKKMDVYKRWGWSEDQIQRAIRRVPDCMMVSEKKIMAIMTFLVNEMGYDSLSIPESSLVFTYSLKERIIPRCSVIKILVSKGLIQEMISLGSLLTIVDKSFLYRFVTMYEQDVPELMKVFQGQLNYQQLFQN